MFEVRLLFQSPNRELKSGELALQPVKGLANSIVSNAACSFFYRAKRVNNKASYDISLTI